MSEQKKPLEHCHIQEAGVFLATPVYIEFGGLKFEQGAHILSEVPVQGMAYVSGGHGVVLHILQEELAIKYCAPHNQEQLLVMYPRFV